MIASNDDLITLAIETSCDDTSAAVLRGSSVLSNIVSSQIDGLRFGGIVPELASRAHQANIVPVIRAALSAAYITPDDIGLIAVTKGPGLIGSLLVGVNFAKAMAFGLQKPLVGVNHIEAHVLASFLEKDKPVFPFIALIVSGGHTLLVEAQNPGQYRILGETVDDAAGECFDKTARLLGLTPVEGALMAGPVIDRLASQGNPKAIAFPRPMLQSGDLNFSFSGLKTSVLHFVQKQNQPLAQNLLADACASFQEAAVDVLVGKTRAALKTTGICQCVLSGGVAANSRLRARLTEVCAQDGVQLFMPARQYCTDNAAMIGITGLMHYRMGRTDNLGLSPKASLRIA
ncbi:MAG TPA: tRNA (adenosine(37)-N6)-threonylcarbamoyltransferase complex transferase subunit TsaD [bacterium]|nr:tRNA (adenosine(37)-N6)-threonylcarbamoyltransferase complex transferase subunit TsaD [bacterium]HMW36714.1 tRNA (adenosine(37)-N6)-threonylcarbamoyltransferase complex transferase subunit TsaD [bacterium]HMY35169.1 tRNA (adenosine(37)-N6)-threonylcarbamoyltransferase complex transferase subunit TsaD [bacterium]HMZ03701.1 tRNA (adenosine(37)-N6)-threonylcarbamoyltransferase complex transferase subunit TsaD [bacterium]HNB10322.1 tRNA (adenosine(37)-N6)-threonylcarbamoyltransferase complex tra